MIYNALFIGGSRDGRRIPVADRAFVRFPMSLCELDNEGRRLMAQEGYRREILAGVDARFRIFVLETMTTDEAMRQLVEGYKPE